MSPEDLVASVNRRRALAVIAVGVVAPGALAACMNNNGKPSGEAADGPAAPTVSFEPSESSVDVVP
ncbi:MAG: L,D-transpeptidase, partial [Mycobacterium sp.]